MLTWEKNDSYVGKVKYSILKVIHKAEHKLCISCAQIMYNVPGVCAQIVKYNFVHAFQEDIWHASNAAALEKLILLKN